MSKMDHDAALMRETLFGAQIQWAVRLLEDVLEFDADVVMFNEATQPMMAYFHDLFQLQRFKDGSTRHRDITLVASFVAPNHWSVDFPPLECTESLVQTPWPLMPRVARRGYYWAWHILSQDNGYVAGAPGVTL